MKMVGKTQKNRCKHEWCDEIKRIRVTNDNYIGGDAYFLWAWCSKCKEQWIKDYRITQYDHAGV